MSDILSDAAAIANDAERGMILARLEALLKLYPDSPFVFLIADDVQQSATLVVPVSNATNEAAFWLLGVAVQALLNG